MTPREQMDQPDDASPGPLFPVPESRCGSAFHTNKHGGDCPFCGGGTDNPRQRTQPHPPKDAHFDGPDYDPAHDKARLTGQIRRVYDLMADGVWRTLAEIGVSTNDPAASISAQLRNLRKQKFGAHTVDKRRRGRAESGLWEYRLVAPQ